MTKLISGRVAKVPSANVSTDRYDFIDLAETEPDLGLPPGPGYVLTSTIQGVRSWLNTAEISGVANVALFSGRANVATLADFANVANVVTTLSNFTTANLVESSSNLYFTAERVNATVQPFLTAANVANFNSTVNATIYPSLTTANVIESSSNLYFTNTRVVSALVAGNQIIIEANGRISANILSTASAAQVTSLSNFTTANLVESSVNLYFTNTRARSAFTAGRGIIISDTGLIQSTISQSEFSSTIDNSSDYIVTDTLQSALTFPYVSSNVKYILRSMHVINISNDTAFITSNVLYTNGNTAYLSYMMPVPTGAVLEFMDRVQLMQANDIINIQGFNASQTPQTGLLSANFTYESISDASTYRGQGMVLPYSNNFVQVANFTESDALLESIKFINHKNYSIPVSLYRGYANGQVRSHLAYNFEIPKNSSVEILQKPKFLKINDGLYAKYINSSNADSISVFTSYKYSAVTSIVSATSSTSVGGNAIITFSTSYPDGTTLYYSLD